MALLLFKRTIWMGLLASGTLMLSFTIYVTYVYGGSFEFIPCSCAGIFRNISWELHLYINITLTIMTAIAAYLYKHSLARNTG
nr:MauE/DoxX family redox-associated membrane protein [Penaeicola halotolerans]